MSDHVSSGHLVNPSAQTVVAPVDARSSAPLSSAPQAQPADASASSAAAGPPHHGAHAASSHESKDDQEASLDHQSVRRHQALVAPSAAAANLASALLQLFQQARSYTQQAHPRPVPETQCHCLVVDESLLVSVEDKQQFEKAIALGGDCKALEAHVISWLQPSPDDIHLTHIPQTDSRKLLHINYTAMEPLGRALLKSAFLVRCGTLGRTQGNAWGLKACGPAIKELPEKLQFSCVPTTPKDRKQFESDAKMVLAQMQIEYTAMWSDPPFQLRGGPAQSSYRETFYVIPRDITNLQSTIERVHDRFELWGSKLRVQAPKSAHLVRCNQCHKLGHHVNHCEMYEGHGFGS